MKFLLRTERISLAGVYQSLVKNAQVPCLAFNKSRITKVTAYLQYFLSIIARFNRILMLNILRSYELLSFIPGGKKIIQTKLSSTAPKPFDLNQN